MTTRIPDSTGYQPPDEQRVWGGNGDDDERWGASPSEHRLHHESPAERRARGLGWFSIGLGLAQIAAPRTVARLVGVRDDETARNAMFAIGMREIASGVGLLREPRAAGWAWTRVGGDVIDLALLGTAFRSEEANRGRVAAATAAVLGVTILDVLTGEQLRQEDRPGPGHAADGSRHIVRAITINRPRPDIYAHWRNFENLPGFMEHLESVEIIDEHRSLWKAKAPAGTSVEWEAEIVEDRPGELISWRSIPGIGVLNAGTVRFLDAPGGRGTEVRVDLRYDPPAGAAGVAVARLFGEEPAQQVQRDLQRFKNVMETGEVMRSDASIHRGPHPARPAAEPM